MKSDVINRRATGMTGHDVTAEVVLVSDVVTFENNVGKFVIPTLTSSMSTDSIVEITIPKKSTQNIINQENMGVSKITNTNYIELVVPKHLFYVEQIIITPNTTRGGEDNCLKSCAPAATVVYNKFYKLQRFIITYIKLNNEKPIIIGVIPT